MVKNRLGKWLLIGTLVVAVVAAGVAAVGVVGVAAQTLGPGGGGFFHGMMGRRQGRDSSFLADELGITLEELDAAREAAQEAALAQAIEEGALTQEEADELLARQALRDYLDPRALMAEALGISEEELATTPMYTWFEELGLDRETFHTQMEAARADALAQAVADGVITQAQADELLESGWGATLRGGQMHGFRGGMRGRGNRGTFRDAGNCPMFGGNDA